MCHPPLASPTFLRRGLLLCALALLGSCDDGAATLPYSEPDLAVNRFPDFALHCPDVFPQFDKNCTSPADCEVVMHQVDCCGSIVATAVASRAVDKFMTFEASCRGMYPACGCPPKPTVDDDGKRLGITSMVQLLCQAGACRTNAL